MFLNFNIVCYHLQLIVQLNFPAVTTEQIFKLFTTCVYKDCKISELIFESGRGMLISGLFGRTYLEEGRKERRVRVRQRMGETLGVNGLALFRGVCDVVYTSLFTATNRVTSEQLSMEVCVNSKSQASS